MSKKESIKEFYKQWYRAMESGDIEGTLSLLTDDFYLKPPNQLAISNKELFRSKLIEFHRVYRETVVWNIEKIEILNSNALVRLSEVVHLISKENGSSLQIEGVHMSLLAEQGHGTWKLKSDISSLNQ